MSHDTLAELARALRAAEADNARLREENERLRETNRNLHRRVQSAEAPLVREWVRLTRMANFKAAQEKKAHALIQHYEDALKRIEGIIANGEQEESGYPAKEPLVLDIKARLLSTRSAVIRTQRRHLSHYGWKPEAVVAPALSPAPAGEAP